VFDAESVRIEAMAEDDEAEADEGCGEGTSGLTGSVIAGRGFDAVSVRELELDGEEAGAEAASGLGGALGRGGEVG
jgi:hypothetical protein